MHNGSPTAFAENTKSPSASALLSLCMGLLPVWCRHLATSREQSETAVSEMLNAFADIGPHINRAGQQSQQINDALTVPYGGCDGLATACERLLSPLQNDPGISQSNAAAIAEVLTMVRNTVGMLEQIAKPFQLETQMVAEQVERMYIGFQYQDRTSQMMTLLETDITRLSQTLTGQQANDLDLTNWLARLESEYAMAEQHHNHHNTKSTTIDSFDENETTFFDFE